jgi:hypothetical protein
MTLLVALFANVLVDMDAICALDADDKSEGKRCFGHSDVNNLNRRLVSRPLTIPTARVFHAEIMVTVLIVAEGNFLPKRPKECGLAYSAWVL